MAPTSKLLKMLVKNNILQLHKAAQKPDKGYAYIFFFFFCQLPKLRKQRAKEVVPILPKASLLSQRTGPPTDVSLTCSKSCLPPLEKHETLLHSDYD